MPSDPAEPGSGTELTVAASTPSVFPYPDGYRDRVELNSTLTSATSAFPASGTVTITSGDAVVQRWDVTLTGTESADSETGLVSGSHAATWDGTHGGATVPGEYTVTTALTTTDGTELTSTTTVAVVATGLSAVQVTRDADPAPAVDGFRDKVTLTVSSTTTTGAPVPVTGTLRIVHKGATIKSWPLTSSATTKFSWDGRTNGAIVAGSYSVMVTAAGPESAARSASALLNVSAASLAKLSGKVRDGAVLTSTLADPGWGGAPTRVSTQWLLDGKPIKGATKTTLTVTNAMLGHKISVRTTAKVLGTQRTGTSEPALVHPGKTSEVELRKKLEQLIRTLPGDYTVRVREVDGGQRQATFNGPLDREPASTSKVFIAYAVFKKIDEGTLKYTTKLPSGLTVDQCLKAMIEPSDNYCAVELRNKVTMAYMNRLNKAGGYNDTHFWYSGGRTKVTSATDLSALIARLGEGKLLSKASTDKFLHLLKTQVWREAIPAGLPSTVRQASKPGTLWAPGGMVQTDVAFVWGAKTRYSIAVMGYNGATIPSITKISKLVYTHLNGGFSKAFVYDRQQMVSTAKITLRSRAGSSAPVTGTYAKGTKIEVIDSRYNWYLVRIGKKTGWIVNTGITLRNPLL